MWFLQTVFTWGVSAFCSFFPNYPRSLVARQFIHTCVHRSVCRSCLYRIKGGEIALEALFGGSWVVISGGISPLIWFITIVTLLLTRLITTHEPPSTPHDIT